jgi:hypothetical protein
VRQEIAAADWLVFQGDMMQVSRVDVMVVRNVEEAVNARWLQVERSRTECAAM